MRIGELLDAGGETLCNSLGGLDAGGEPLCNSLGGLDAGGETQCKSPGGLDASGEPLCNSLGGLLSGYLEWVGLVGGTCGGDGAGSGTFEVLAP